MIAGSRLSRENVADGSVIVHCTQERFEAQREVECPEIRIVNKSLFCYDWDMLWLLTRNFAALSPIVTAENVEAHHVLQLVRAISIFTLTTGLQSVAPFCQRRTSRTCRRKYTHICVEGEWETNLEKTPSVHLTEILNLGLPVIRSLIYYKSSALDHAATEAVIDADIFAELLNNNIQAEDGASGDADNNSSAVQEKPISSTAEAMDHI
uniref:Uncharacterized protein n=1 Tax=Timema tahoe TaxID=61484 RepID=A0A7R9IEE0_9NEOP|nr:unnamed protein product [Timema tahoe]